MDARYGLAGTAVHVDVCPHARTAARTAARTHARTAARTHARTHQEGAAEVAACELVKMGARDVDLDGLRPALHVEVTDPRHDRRGPLLRVHHTRDALDWGAVQLGLGWRCLCQLLGTNRWHLPGAAAQKNGCASGEFGKKTVTRTSEKRATPIRVWRLRSELLEPLWKSSARTYVRVM
jgi:hypothetical protein